MRALDAVGSVAFVLALLALPVVFVMWFRRPSGGLPLRGVLVFGVLLGTFMCAASTSESWGQIRVLDALDQCTPANSSVLVNGRDVSNPAEVLNTLRELRDLPAHHSSPTKRFSIDIVGPSQVSLQLARDSGDPHEYWVFYPMYRLTRYNPIGRLKTALFDAY